MCKNLVSKRLQRLTDIVVLSNIVSFDGRAKIHALACAPRIEVKAATLRLGVLGCYFYYHEG